MLKKIFKLLKSGFVKFYSNKFKVFVSVIILAIVLNIVFYNFNNSNASVRMSLNYAQASEGLNPNSTRFSIYEFTSEEILEKTIEYAGIKDQITAKELKACISIHPADTFSIRDSDEYICTAYNISFRNETDIKDVSTMNILKMYCTAYKEYFIANYGDNSAVLYYDNSHFFNDEPYLKLSAIELKAKQIQRYVEQRINENTSFTDEKTGHNFLSIMKEVNQVVNYDIPNIFGFIRESGVASNKNIFIPMLEYKNKISSLDYQTKLAYYNSDNEGIGLYDEAMSGIVLIPALDNEDKFYMSRTETALDEMADNANESLVKSNETQKEIARTSHTINQMKEVETTPENSNKADKLIVELDNRISDITDKLQALDTSYIRYKTQNYITFKYNVTSFLQKINIKGTVCAVVLFTICCYMVCVFLSVPAMNKSKNKDGEEENEDEKEGGILAKI